MKGQLSVPPPEAHAPWHERQPNQRPDKLAIGGRGSVVKGKNMFRLWTCGVAAAAFFAALAVAEDKPKKAVSDIKIDGKTLTQWAREITDRDPSNRQIAMLAVIQFGSAGRQAAHELISELGDRDPGLRAHAAYALGMVGMDGQDGPSGLRALADRLSDSQAIVRYRAATALGNFGPAAKEALLPLWRAYRDPQSAWEVRKAVIYAFGNIGLSQDNGPPNRQVSGWLREALRDPCAQIRSDAIAYLVSLGKPTDQEQHLTRQAFKAMLNDKDKTVAIWARVGLCKFDQKSEAYVRYIADFLKSPETDLRVQAARALGIIGPDAESSTLALADAGNDSDPRVALTAMAALKSIGSAAIEALDTLYPLSESPNEAIRGAAKQTIEAITKKPYQPRKAGAR
jgi:HEAT repeat protein